MASHHEGEKDLTILSSNGSGDGESATDVTSSVRQMSSSKPRDPKIPRRGRTADHPIWDYFTQLRETEESQCNACKVKLSGHKASNNLAHLKSKHNSKSDSTFIEYQKKKVEYDAKKSATTPKASASALTGQTLQQAFASIASNKQPYVKNSQRQVEITDCLAMFIGTNSVAMRVVETTTFQNLIHKLDPRYQIPNRHEISDTIKELKSKIRISIQSKINEAGNICICADIWSRPGLVESFLGISAHFYSRLTHQKCNVLLGLELFESPHTGDRLKQILDDVLHSWGIESDKVLRFITDNGSNMVKALRNEALIYKLVADNVDRDVSDELDEFGFEAETDETEELDTPEVSQPKHMRCFAHSLMCVLRNTVDRDIDFDVFRKSVFATVKKIGFSVRLQERLKQLAGLKLIVPSQTRWNSTYFVFERILRVTKALDELAFEERWDPLPWRTLELYCNFLKPFATHTDFLQGHKYPTISTIIPTLLDLCDHLQKFATDDKLGSLATTVQEKLDEQFGYITNVQHAKFDATYVSAAFLDPTLALCLDDVQVNEAKKLIGHMAAINETPMAQYQPSGAPSNLPASVLERIEKRRLTASVSSSSTIQTEMTAYWNGLVSGK